MRVRPYPTSAGELSHDSCAMTYNSRHGPILKPSQGAQISFAAPGSTISLERWADPRTFILGSAPWRASLLAFSLPRFI